ncbi:MAG: CNNM domain-containing protein [Chthoniobacterales bacterium]
MIWLVIVGCWVASFLFSGIEAGLLAVDPVRLRHQVNQRRPAAMRLHRLLQHPERLLMTVLIVTNLAEISALLLLTRSFVMRFGTAGYALAVLVALPLHLFLLRVLPKSLFRRFPFRALAAMSGVLELTAKILSPFLIVGERLGRFLLPRRVANRARLFAAREELKQIAAQSEREGGLTSTERAMIHNVVDFRNIRARDVMVPIAEAVAVRPETPVRDAIQLGASRGIDRLPVISEQHQAIGLVNVLDLLLDGENEQPVRSQMRHVVTADFREPAYRLIRRLREARVGLAAIVDREHQLIGIATSEELIRRLVQSA